MDETRDLSYAWCLDHGRLHRFSQEDGAWCSALWVPLDGTSEGTALANKQSRFGEARFFDELPREVQTELIEARS